MKRYRGVIFATPLLAACGSIGEEFGTPSSKTSTPPPLIATSSATDTRAVRTAAVPPPPITGGTLLMTSDGTRAVAADPDRDRVSIVRFDGDTPINVALEPGDEPGRVAEDSAARVHVALRRGGAVVTIDLDTGRVLARRAVCGAPRGIAYDVSKDLVHVACAGGELVSLPASGGDAVRRLKLDVDLRDVIARPGGALFVSRFKSGDVLAIDPGGAVTSRAKLRPIERNSDTATVDPMEPAVAWRTIGTPQGTAIVLHQYGLASPIKITSPHSGQGADAGAPPQPGPFGRGPGFSSAASEPYGTPPSGCGGLVQPALSEVNVDASTVDMGAPIIAPVLTVDAAISPDNSFVLLAHAGGRDPDAPPSGTGFDTFSVGTGVTLVSRLGLTLAQGISASGVSASCTSASMTLQVDGQVTAVATNPVSSTSLPLFAVQTREPATIAFFASAVSVPRVVELGGASVFDTGHELFHRNAGAGIACASCHAEGGEDGRVWRFDPIGERRTQAVHVGLEGTAPFHWDGDMGNFGVLVDEVMVRRMGGPHESDARKAALQNWLFSLRPPAAIGSPDDASALRGQALFQSPDVGCSGCHAGPHLTSNQNMFVGTTTPGHLLQVPSLHGIAYRAPFLHDGCAATLRDRFDPACGGGDQHGHTSGLADADVSDLIAYLETL